MRRRRSINRERDAVASKVDAGLYGDLLSYRRLSGPTGSDAFHDGSMKLPRPRRYN